MNKIKGLLVAALVVGAVKADTNKTFLAGRPAGVNLAMEGTTWHTQVDKMMADKQFDEKFGASMQVVGFYRENTNEKDLGQYFGFDNKRSLVVGNPATSAVDIDSAHLIHNASTRVTGTINLSYQHSVGGVYLCYQQDLDKHKKGMYYKVRTPIVWEESRARLNVIDETVGRYYNRSHVATDMHIADYFSGSFSQTSHFLTSDGENVSYQKALQYARIDNRSHSRAGLGDIDVVVGWSFKETDNTHVAVNGGFTIPTSPSPDGVYLSGCQVGNRGHWGLGAGFDAKFTPWKDEDWKLEIDMVVDWRFLFRDWEIRTLGLKDHNWGQYMLLAQVGRRGVFPAANILTQRVSVRPGNQIDGRLGLAFSYSDFTFDLGYNLYWREREQVDWTCQCFHDGAYSSDGAYGIPSRDYNTTVEFINTLQGRQEASIADRMPVDANNTGLLHAYDVDASVAETPWQLTHKIYGGIGYAFNAWDAPVMIGLGGGYEFASDQKALENWEIYGKVGFSF